MSSPTSAAAARPRLPLWLLCLALSAFVTGTDNYVIAGVLRDISGSMHQPEAVIGQLITAFSITYAVGALLMAVWTSRLPRRAVLLLALAVFVATNVGGALAPNFPVLMVFRVLAAIAAATLTPAAFTVTVTLAPRERIGRYLGLVMLGQALALVIGVPIGVWLGALFNWRATLLFVAALAALVTLGLMFLLPKLERTPPLTLRQRLSPLSRTPVVVGLLALVIGATGNFMTISYIAPITDKLSSTGSGGLSGLLSVMGIATAVGAIVGGRVADAIGPGRTIVAALSLQVVATVLLGISGWTAAGRVPVVLVGVLLVGWGIFGGALGPPLQTRLLKLAGPAGNEVVALNSSSMFIGTSLSGLVGGIVLAGHGAVAVLWAAAAVTAVSALMLAVSVWATPDEPVARKSQASSDTQAEHTATGGE
ncbi:MFS transporter [Actinoallomurus acanthiterrae]